jgi:hypothetical protein
VQINKAYFKALFKIIVPYNQSPKKEKRINGSENKLGNLLTIDPIRGCFARIEKSFVIKLFARGNKRETE